MGSSRLPGKVMLPLRGRPTIERVLERLSQVNEIDETVVATTVLAEEAPLVEHVQRLGVQVFRGSAQDVLSRYWNAARTVSATRVVRITSDCPLLAPEVTSAVIRRFARTDSELDYCSNTLERTYPRGLDTEVFSFEALARAHKSATTVPDREHVTPYIYRHPNEFRIAHVTDSSDNSALRWTLDTQDDLALLERIFDGLGERASSAGYADVLELVGSHPEWSSLNAHVRQKQYGE
jgi:spore coat polysaccharide biosynthesis protein SpsF